MSEAKKLSIIIVAYHNATHLEKCVASIYEKLVIFFDWEIIIVNNDENQNIEELAIDFSKVKVINNKKNVGFGSGINLGVSEVKGEYLLFLNPDTQILTDNIEKVFDEFRGNIGIIGGGIIDPRNKKQEWSAGREISFYDLVRNNLGINRSCPVWNSSQKTRCDWVTGTCFFIKKRVFQELSGFDETFFMYFEDMDLCKRARLVGYEILYFPDFNIFHSGGESYVDKKMQKKHYYDSLEYYFQKHCHWFGRLIVRFLRWTKDKFSV